MRAFWISTLGVIAVDQASKWGVLRLLHLDERLSIEVLPPFLNFHMAWNRGVNFGLFGGLDMRWILVALALAVSFAVTWWMIRDRAGRLGQISAGLLVGGAIGNVIDRVVFGAVVDFLNMSCCGIENPYAFNIADIAIFAGAAGLALFGSGGRKRP